MLETREPVTGLDVVSPPGADPGLQTWWQVSFVHRRLTDAQAPHRIDHPDDLCHVPDGHANGPAPLAARLDALLDHAVGKPEVLPRDDIAMLGIRVT